MPKNASKPQELTDCPCDLGEEIANSELCPQTPGVHVKGRDAFSSSTCWVLADVFARKRGNSQETGVTFGCCSSAATLPGWLQSSFLPIFPMEATHSIANAGSREGSTILMSHHVTRDNSLTAVLHKAITQHKWQLFPRGATLGVYARWLLTAILQPQNVAGEQEHV